MKEVKNAKSFAHTIALGLKRANLIAKNTVMGNQLVYIFNNGIILMLSPLPRERTQIKYISGHQALLFIAPIELSGFEDLIVFLKGYV